MANYNYVAKDEKSKTVRGTEFAMSERELVMRLARKNLTIISIKQAQQSKLFLRFSKQNRKIGTFELMIFCRQLATILKGGVPLIKGLEIIAGEAKNPALQSALIEIGYYIRQGDSFSASLKRMPEKFSPLFISITEAGEKVGALDVMMERLARYLTAQDRLNKKIVAAMAYPSAVLVFFFFALGVMTLFLVPKFKSMYSGFGAKLPEFTLAIFGISDFLLRYIVFIAAGIIAFVLYVQNVLLKTRIGRYKFDKMILGLPLFGMVIKKAAVSKFARTFSTLLDQGIPVPESLELVGRSAGNAVVEEASAKASKLIVDGEKIPVAFRKAEIFPSLMIQMTMVGTESGNLPELLDKTADFYEEEVDVFLGVMSSLIEPVLIVILGAILGVFIVALYLPIFKLSETVGRGV